MSQRDVIPAQNKPSTFQVTLELSLDELIAINSNTSPLAAKLDAIISALNTTNTRLQTIITDVDQVEELLTSINTNTGRIP